MAEKPSSNQGVESGGKPSVDPTKNVLDLVEAANKRQDDLRAAQDRLHDAENRHLDELQKLRAQHQRELDKAESDRLNSIRQVDREEVTKTATSANTAIAALAKTTQDLAASLADRVATTAQIAENRQQAFATDMGKRLSQLELSMSEGKGKQTVADPQMEKLTALVELLARNQATGTGKSEGLSQGWGILGGAILLALAIYGGVFKSATTATAQPQVIYVPAPAVGATGVPTVPAGAR